MQSTMAVLRLNTVKNAKMKKKTLNKKKMRKRCEKGERLLLFNPNLIPKLPPFR